MLRNDAVSLNCSTAPREVTRNALIRPRSVIKASVMPSANQEWSVSRDRSGSGRTARDRIRPASGFAHRRSRQPPALTPTKSVSVATMEAAVPSAILTALLPSPLPPGVGSADGVASASANSATPR